jgi:hypothetical protein
MTSRTVVLSLLIFISSIHGEAENSMKTFSGIQEENEYLKLVKLLLAAKEKSWEADATIADVDAVLNFYSDSLNYDHMISPTKHFSFTGKELLKSGIVSHLGETRNVKLKILKYIATQNVVVVEYSLKREVKTAEGWKQQQSKSVMIIDFDSAHKIQHISEYI